MHPASAALIAQLGYQLTVCACFITFKVGPLIRTTSYNCQQKMLECSSMLFT